MTVRRDWRLALAAHEGQPCRRCGQFPRELAHIIPRTYDRQRGAMQGTIVVRPEAVVPLCPPHHQAYDSHRLNLADYLTEAERKHAISLVGEETARRYIEGRET